MSKDQAPSPYLQNLQQQYPQQPQYPQQHSFQNQQHYPAQPYQDQPYNQQPYQHQMSGMPQQQPGMPQEHSRGMAPQPYTQQPLQQMNYQQNPNGYPAQVNEWKFGLCDCFSAFGLCCKTCCCPCITYGETKSQIEGKPEDCTMYGLIYCAAACFGVAPCLAMLNRNEVRNRRGIKGSGSGDFCTHCCCHCCALIQENREVQQPLL